MACRPFYEKILDELREIHPRATAQELLQHLDAALFLNVNDPRVIAYAMSIQATGDEVV